MKIGRQALHVLAAAFFTLALTAAPAHAAKGWAFKEVFGSANQPTFSGAEGARNMTVDDDGDLYVLNADANTVSRWNPDGTAANFAALGTNVIDGAGGADATPSGSIGGFVDQIAIDNSGGANDGNIYVSNQEARAVDIFSPGATFLGRLTGCGATTFSFGSAVTVDEAGDVYAGFFDGFRQFVAKYEPAARPPVNGDCTGSFEHFGVDELLAGAGPTDGYLFATDSSRPGYAKVDPLTGDVEYRFGQIFGFNLRHAALDLTTGHVFITRTSDVGSLVVEYDASAPTEAVEVSRIENAGGTVRGAAVTDNAELLYVARNGTPNIEVWEAIPAQEVETGSPALVSGAKATVTGTVRPLSTDVTECYFEYGRTTAYDRRAPCSPDAASLPIDNGTYQVTGELTGMLANGSTYHYRLVTNGIARDAGEDRTLKTANTYSTAPATAVTATTATLNGTVKPEGVALTDCYFEYGESFPTFRAPCEPSPGAIGTGDADVPVSADITGLDPDTSYRFHLIAVNSLGKITTTERRLTTLGPPIVFTQAARVLQTSATLRARINPAGQASTYFFEWGPDTGYGTRVPADTNFNLPAGTGFVSVNIPISGLRAQSAYHFRVIASNDAGRTVGYDWPFLTLGANGLLSSPILRIGRKQPRRCARGKVRRGGRCVKRKKSKKKAKRHSGSKARRLSGAGMGARAGGVS